MCVAFNNLNICALVVHTLSVFMFVACACVRSLLRLSGQPQSQRRDVTALHISRLADDVITRSVLPLFVGFVINT